MAAHRITQLDPPISVITPLGLATAHFIWTEDRGVFFGVFQDETAEQWWFENFYIRMEPSVTDSPHAASKIVIPPEMAAKLAPHRARYKTKE